MLYYKSNLLYTALSPASCNDNNLAAWPAPSYVKRSFAIFASALREVKSLILKQVLLISMRTRITTNKISEVTFHHYIQSKTAKGFPKPALTRLELTTCVGT
jgi:hypothetical protein